MKSLIWAVALVLAGCTVTPRRFVHDDISPAGCGYCVTSSANDGFDLEVFLKQYSFTSAPDVPIRNARKCFDSVATALSSRAAKLMVPLTKSDVSTTISQNPTDGYFSAYATGRVRFVTAPGSAHSQ